MKPVGSDFPTSFVCFYYYYLDAWNYFFVKGMYAQAINYRIDSFDRLIFLRQRDIKTKQSESMEVEASSV